MSARFILLVVMTALVGACSRGETVSCSTGDYYLEAESADLLRVPDNLDVPDETEALLVPGQTPPRESNNNALDCLEYSPAFAVADEDED